MASLSFGGPKAPLRQSGRFVVQPLARLYRLIAMKRNRAGVMLAALAGITVLATGCGASESAGGSAPIGTPPCTHQIKYDGHVYQSVGLTERTPVEFQRVRTLRCANAEGQYPDPAARHTRSLVFRGFDESEVLAAATKREGTYLVMVSDSVTEDRRLRLQELLKVS